MSEYPYPTMDAPLPLPSGTVVRTRNLVVLRGRNTTVLTVTIETPTPASDVARVASEAHEVAVLHNDFATMQGASTINVAICRTQACIELREPTDEFFLFERVAAGTWVGEKLQL